jgi:hypothetical protein
MGPRSGDVRQAVWGHYRSRTRPLLLGCRPLHLAAYPVDARRRFADRFRDIAKHLRDLPCGNGDALFRRDFNFVVRSDYRKQAEECRVQASKAVREQGEAAWLKMAAQWQRLAEDVDRARGKKRD